VPDPSSSERPPDQAQFSRQIDATVARKLQAQRWHSRIVWSGLGMMGLIGWSVTVPTLLGLALGIWLDRRHPGAHSWTMALLVAGLILGCWNAWHWINKESAEHE
jgi:ATP synthase protein I